MGKKKFTNTIPLVVTISLLILITNTSLVSSINLSRNYAESRKLPYNSLETNEISSLIESKGEFVDIELSDSCVDDYKYDQLVYDESLYKYLGLEQIHRDLIDGVSGYETYSGTCVAVVDNLVDFNHPNLKRAVIAEGTVHWEPAVTKVVLINNQEVGDDPAYEILDYDDNNLSAVDLYDSSVEARDYLNEEFSLYDFTSASLWGHGTSVAGIINQIAPGAEIISVAMPSISTTTQLYYSIMNLLKFLEDKKDSFHIKIVNNSYRWGLKNKELSQSYRNAIETKIRELLVNENKKLFWVNAAGNKEEGVDGENNDWNLVYPSHLADNWEDDFDSFFGEEAEIDGKTDYDGNTAIATGFVSVGSVYDYGVNLGKRSGLYVFDNDMDNTGDLKLMAPGFDIRSTFNTKILEGVSLIEHATNQTYFTGTSAAAPVVSGLAALLCSIEPSLEGFEIEKKLTENALYDSNVDLVYPELLQKYGHGMINPLKTLGVYDSDLSNLDSDADGLYDYQELYSSHTSIDDSDCDDDGLTDGEEVNDYNTDPFNCDSDADGINDFEEVVEGADGYITNPLTADTDGDFMSDGYEIANNLDPTDTDSDGDGLSDGEEVLIYHSDPTKIDTDEDGLNDNTEVVTYNTDPADADSDNDGLSDKEEVLLWGDGYITDPNDADSDNDGLLDGQEYAYGSNPNDSDTDGDYIPDGEEVIAGTDGYETDPTKWDTDGDGMDDFSEINNGLDPTFNDASVDSDHDALNNLEEFYLGTDPHDADSDNDGMKDGWEVTYSLNPLSDDATADADGDGLKNIDEYLYDCNPRDTDSDNDGLNDKLEVVTYGTDPNDSDTDNDGWSDYYEVYTSGTSPIKADTDGDGITDRTEYYWWINTHGQSSTSAKSKIKIKDVDGDRLSDGYEKSHSYNPLDSDMDNDGLSDGDEVCTYHTNPNDSDSDDDGYSDLTELINGTDPNDTSDYPGSGGGGGGWIP